MARRRRLEISNNRRNRCVRQDVERHRKIAWFPASGPPVERRDQTRNDFGGAYRPTAPARTDLRLGCSIEAAVAALSAVRALIRVGKRRSRPEDGARVYPDRTVARAFAGPSDIICETRMERPRRVQTPPRRRGTRSQGEMQGRQPPRPSPPLHARQDAKHFEQKAGRCQRGIA